MRESASGRRRPALGERCLISERKERRRFCLEGEEKDEEGERADAKRAPSGGAAGGVDAAATRARAVSAVYSPAAMRRRLATRISPRIEPLIPSSSPLPLLRKSSLLFSFS